jgi:hypothetical protein
MTKRQFVVIAFRLFAIYLAINAIERAADTIRYFNSPIHDSVASDVIGLLFALAIEGWIFYILWSKTEWLMHKMFESRAFTDPEPSEVIVEDTSEIKDDYYEERVSTESVECTVVGLLGLWLSISYVPRLLSQLINYFFNTPRIPSLGYDYHTQDLINILVWSLPQAAFGLWLLLRPWQLQVWLSKMRPQTDEEETPHTE